MSNDAQPTPDKDQLFEQIFKVAQSWDHARGFEGHPDGLRGMCLDLLEKVLLPLLAAQPPAAPVARQHIGWLKQYIGGMDETNWKDMRLRAERQLEELCADLAPAAPVGTKEELPADLRFVVDALKGRFFECGGHMREMSENEAFDIALALRRAKADHERCSAETSGQEGWPFQKRVLEWLMACFSMEVCRDGVERNHRFLEEALELVQSLGCTRSEAHQLVDYVFARPVGEPVQELGGVMVTLAALCFPHDLNMNEAAERELVRVWTKIDKIRAKQAAKPKHSPLPEYVSSEPQPVEVWRTDLDNAPNGLREFFLVRPQGLHPASGKPFIPTTVQRIDGEFYSSDNEIDPIYFGQNEPDDSPMKTTLEWKSLPADWLSTSTLTRPK